MELEHGIEDLPHRGAVLLVVPHVCPAPPSLDTASMYSTSG